MSVRDHRSRRSAFLAAAAALGLAACGAISGLDGLAFDGAAGGAGGSTGSHHHHASSSGSGGHVAQGGGGGVPVESCLNGVDDDGNNLVDCEDPACSAFACTTEAPPGWTGPIAFYFGGEQDVACPPEFPMKAFEGGTLVVNTPIDCSPCACGTEPCKPINAPTYLETGCSTVAGTFLLTPDACTIPPNNPGISFPKAQTQGATNCMSSGGQETSHPAPTFNDHAIGCAPASVGGGCGTGVCAPVQAPPLEAKLCVYQAGAGAPCPAGFTNGRTVNTGVDDTRACLPCDCGGHSNTCNIDVRYYDDSTCMNDIGGVGPNICLSLNGVAAFTVHVSSPCNPQGGGQGGSATAADPVTICCLP